MCDTGRIAVKMLWQLLIHFSQWCCWASREPHLAAFLRAVMLAAGDGGGTWVGRVHCPN